MSEVPHGWAATSLGEVGRYLNGRGFKKSEWSKSGRPIVRIQDLTGSGKGHNYFAGDVAEENLVRDGELLISWAATIDAFIWRGPEACVNQHIFKVESFIDHRFHYYAARAFANDLRRRTHGGGIVHVTRDRFDSTPLLLPPIREQGRIVQKLEELLSDLDAGIAALERARANLKRYRAAVLKAAVEGRLTEKWRAAHPKAESAEKLIERILIERKMTWEAVQLKKFAEKKQAPPKGWKDKYIEPVKPDVASLPSLPTGWRWATLAQLGELDRGKSKHRPRNAAHLYGGSYPFIQTGDIKGAGTFLHQYVQTYSDAGLKQSKLWPAGTLCITIAANIAETTILGIDACFPDSVVGFVPSESISVRYVQLQLQAVRKRIEAMAPATAQKNINLEVLYRVPIALAPESEQKRVVDEFDAIGSVEERAGLGCEVGLARASKLRQSILKRAFEGKLVPQDPKDEPASELLARIRADRGRCSSTTMSIVKRKGGKIA